MSTNAELSVGRQAAQTLNMIGHFTIALIVSSRPEIFRTVIGPLLALVGTVLVAFLGYRQWRKQQDWVRYGGFVSERQAAYKELWQKLEAVHLYVRTESFDETKFDELVRSANVHLIEYGLHVDRGEKKRANDYMAALCNLGKLLAASNVEKASGAKVRKTLYDTEEIPPDVLNLVQGLQQAYTLVEEHRERLIEHFRKVLGADFVGR